MIIVSVDPGKTTGWSVLSYINGVRTVVEYHQDPDYSFTKALKDKIDSLGAEDVLVVERAPERGSDPWLVRLYNEILAYVNPQTRVLKVLPGTWKPYITTFEPELKKSMPSKLRHARDSVCMAVYIIRTSRYKDTGGSK